MASWLQETALRLYPIEERRIANAQNSRLCGMPDENCFTKAPTPPKISPLEKSAVRIMRKLYEATGGQPQRWETLDNLGAVKADAAAIAYAVERGWLLISGGLHSLSLTEDGRQRLK